MRHIVINGVSSETFNFKFVNMTKQSVLFAESKTEYIDNVDFFEINVKDHQRKTLTTTYELGLVDATEETIDAIKRWLAKENVPFQPNHKVQREYTAYRFKIIGTEQSIIGVYVLTLTVEHSGVAYAKEVKNAKRVGNKLVFENSGTVAVYPTFEFVATGDLSMIGFTDKNGKTFQLGTNNGPTIIRSGQRVKIEMDKMAVYVNDTRNFKVFNLASRPFLIETGHQELGVIVNSGATLPSVLKASIREGYL